MADLQCSPRGSLAPLKYLFDITRECELIHRSNQKRAPIIFYACVNTPNRLQRRGRNSALPPDAIAHSPQIEHSGTAEKSGKRKFPVEWNAKEKDAGIIQ
jgi:hypothetical protein